MIILFFSIRLSGLQGLQGVVRKTMNDDLQVFIMFLSVNKSSHYEGKCKEEELVYIGKLLLLTAVLITIISTVNRQ